MTIVLQTERLTLRQFIMSDAPFIVELLNSPNWLQFIGDRNIKTVAEAQSYLLQGPLLSYVVSGFGLYMVELKDSGMPIGMCGLLKRPYLEYLDIGYALLPQYEGMGYGYEIATATLQYAFGHLQQQHVAAITAINNQRSVALLKKMRFYDSGTVNPDDKTELLLFIKDA
jgi:ribosomal-protein-alanine N-acetyltransferase